MSLYTYIHIVFKTILNKQVMIELVELDSIVLNSNTY